MTGTQASPEQILAAFELEELEERLEFGKWSISGGTKCGYDSTGTWKCEVSAGGTYTF